MEAGADRSIKDINGKTALILAAYQGHEGCVKILLGAGANKDAKDNVSTSDACDDPLMADDPTYGLSMETLPSSILLGWV